MRSHCEVSEVLGRKAGTDINDLAHEFNLNLCYLDKAISFCYGLSRNYECLSLLTRGSK